MGVAAAATTNIEKAAITLLAQRTDDDNDNPLADLDASEDDQLDVREVLLEDC